MKYNEYDYDKLGEPIIISKPIFDLLLKQDNCSELYTLYSFYYYTAKWQNTDKPKATNSYVATGLKWSEARVKKYKQKLIKLGLIKTIKKRSKKTGKITGFYVLVNFLWSLPTNKQETNKDEESTQKNINNLNQRYNLITSGTNTETNKDEESTNTLTRGLNLPPQVKPTHKCFNTNNNIINTNSTINSTITIHNTKNNKSNLNPKKNIQKKDKNFLYQKNNGKLKRTVSKLKKKKPTIQERNKKFKPIAIKLSKIIQSSKNITHSSQQIKSWTNEIRRLNEENNVSIEDMNKTLDWYSTAIGGQYIPVVESGKSFREKYVKLLAAIERESSTKKSEFKNRTGLSAKDEINKLFKT